LLDDLERELTQLVQNQTYEKRPSEQSCIMRAQIIKREIGDIEGRLRDLDK
jgi:hypothetical protein